MQAQYLSPEHIELLSQIQELTRRFFEEEEEPVFCPGETSIALMEPSYNWREVNQVTDALFSRILTLNHPGSDKVERFEQAWCQYIGTIEPHINS